MLFFSILSRLYTRLFSLAPVSSLASLFASLTHSLTHSLAAVYDKRIIDPSRSLLQFVLYGITSCYTFATTNALREYLLSVLGNKSSPGLLLHQVHTCAISPRNFLVRAAIYSTKTGTRISSTSHLRYWSFSVCVTHLNAQIHAAHFLNEALSQDYSQVWLYRGVRVAARVRAVQKPYLCRSTLCISLSICSLQRRLPFVLLTQTLHQLFNLEASETPPPWLIENQFCPIVALWKRSRVIMLHHEEIARPILIQWQPKKAACL